MRAVKRFFLTTLAVAAGAIAPLGAQAVTYNWSFEAVIDNTPTNPFVGNTMRFDFAFDRDSLSLSALSITVQGLGTTSCNTAGRFVSLVDGAAPTDDTFSFSVGNDTCGDLGIYTIVGPASLTLRDVDGLAFNPWYSSIDLAQFDRGSLTLDICAAAGIGSCVPGTNKFTLTTGIPYYVRTPEPGTLALLGLGLAGLGLSRRRKAA